MELLVFFECQVRGVKFYDLREAGARWGTSLRLVKEPSDLHDPLCRSLGPWDDRIREIARVQLREHVIECIRHTSRPASSIRVFV